MKKIIVYILLLASVFPATAQKLKKAELAIIQNLKTDVFFLADDKLEGRRAGTAGEEKAAEYIAEKFKAAGLRPKGDNNSYLQAFDITDGKEVKPTTLFMVNGKELQLFEDYFPLVFSANASIPEVPVATSLSEKGVPWFKDIEMVLEENKNNPHFDIYEYVQKEVKIAADKGATALVIYNSETTEDHISFLKKDKTPVFAIPVIYLTANGRERHLKDASTIYDIKLRVEIGEGKRTGHNVVGFIDNRTTNTVIIGAHYDHLGYGEDGNSLHKGSGEIHNGADDNASGTAALIELARQLSKSKYRANNYLFLAFSGEELGLLGSKYFTDHPTIDLGSANYMINLDMVGRLTEDSKAITVGGFGTSPVWADVMSKIRKVPFSIRTDSSGVGPSDHTSFYRKDIPVLFFFTGVHSDYHKPTDDADKINYTGQLQIIQYIMNLVQQLDKKGKLPFTSTREPQVSTSARFSVTLGIMPDYAFSGAGVRVDGVSEGRPAQKAGIQKGDIIVKLGDYTVTDVETYMQALSKFKKGEQARVSVKRGNEDFTAEIVF